MIINAEKTTESPTQVVRIRDRRHCKHVMDKTRLNIEHGNEDSV